MIIRVADYIADFLEKKGITDCFMVTGGGAMHLDDAIGHNDGIHCIFNHHEQGCSVAAEGYARLTGRMAAVCVTSGPGGTNAITGVMGAWVDSIPMFVLSGQVKRETTTWSCSELNLRQLGDQEFDIVGSVSNMTKYAVMVTDPLSIAYHLEKALHLANEGRKGPVWLDIPLDVQGAKVDTDELVHFDAQSERPHEVRRFTSAQAQAVADRIAKAKSPLFLVGTGVRLGGAYEAFQQLEKKYGIPVVTAWNANDVCNADDPYYVGMPGTVGIRSGNFAVQNCDLLISIGCRLNIRMIGYNHFDFAKNAFKIIVDIDPRELYKPTVQADMPINADSLDFILRMTEAEYQPVPEHKKWLDWCRDLLHRYPAACPEYREGQGGEINPYIFIDRLFDKLLPDDRIVCSNGSACVITFQAAKLKKGQRMFTNSGCAAMGYGLPAAIGAAVGQNNRVICIEGDGSIMMNIQELATVAYNKLNIKIFILNNNGYHSIRQTQRNLFTPPFIGIDGDSGICFPDFGLIAKAFGIDFYRITTADKCTQMLENVLSSAGACICEVIVDPEQNFAPKSSSKVLPDGRIVSPSLDDMAPFLPREEFDRIHFE
ncbi:MAG: thiamine pyrophosphate-binding protein [Oscillospiraceae bacterium]|nr:thiamine pyrophosphate-binding protein [Oscillospiraceae bacterium]